MSFRFKHYFAIPDFKVDKSTWPGYECTYEEAEALTAKGATIAIDLQHEDYAVLDYDGKHGDTGRDKFREHRDAYSQFFASTRIETTGSGAKHVYFNKVGPLPAKPWKDIEVDVLDGQAHRWCVIPPSLYKDGKKAPYTLSQDLDPQDLPDGLLAEIRAGSTPTGVGTSSPTAGVDIPKWKPRRVRLKRSFKPVQYYGSQHSPDKESLCDSECGIFYRKTNDSWPLVSRHGEVVRYLAAYILPLVDAGRTFGALDMQRCFTIASICNDTFHCQHHAPKFTTDDQIAQDVERVFRLLAQEGHGIKFHNGSLAAKDTRSLTPNWLDGPHEIWVTGDKGAGKTVYIAHLVNELISAKPMPILWLTKDDSAKVINHLCSQATVYALKDAEESGFHNKNAHAKVWSELDDLIDNGLAESGIEHGVIILEPFVDVAESFKGNGSDYAESGDFVRQLKMRYPGFYFVLTAHNAKNSESRDNTAIIGSQGYGASTRFGATLKKPSDKVNAYTLSTWGNYQEPETFVVTFDTTPVDGMAKPMADISTYTLTPRAEHKGALDEVDTAIEELLNTDRTSLVNAKGFLESRFKTLKLEDDGDHLTLIKRIPWADYVAEDDLEKEIQND